MTIDHCVMRFLFDRPLREGARAKDLRGAIASLRREDALFHQHTEDSSPIFTYPLIQYKILHGTAFLVGLGQGANAVGRLELLEERLRMGRDFYTVRHQEIAFGKVEIGIMNSMIDYLFLSPWLALNTANYQSYQRMGNLAKRRELLESVLIGNIISMSKGLGYDVPARIYGRLGTFEEVPVVLKGTPMIGFWGSFHTNFLIPDLWAIGKSVARGFGTVITSR
jgi:hypothetical protein